MLKSQVYPLINGITNHDAQAVILLDRTYYFSKSPLIYRRVIDNYSVQKFSELLSHEILRAVFLNDNIITIFNSFSDTYLKIFQSCFLTLRRRDLTH